jgi:hypothetical protein
MLVVPRVSLDVMVSISLSLSLSLSSSTGGRRRWRGGAHLRLASIMVAAAVSPPRDLRASCSPNENRSGAGHILQVQHRDFLHGDEIC